MFDSTSTSAGRMTANSVICICNGLATEGLTHPSAETGILGQISQYYGCYLIVA